VLPGFDVIDHAKFDSEAKIAALPVTVSLRTRHLEGAVLIGATLRKADFTAAQLQGAEFLGTQLQGVSLERAQLQGAVLWAAQLQGASLDQAHVQGANLQHARLQGASLEEASLQGASLWRAKLQGASLDDAQLQGASLDQAQLQGASLNGVQLQGAVLWGASLQGASLDRAQLQGAALEKVFAWRADARHAVLENTHLVSPEIRPKYECWKDGERSACDWSAKSFDELKKIIADEVPDGDKRDNAMESIEQGLDPSKQMKDEDEMAKAWESQARSSPDTEAYEKRVAEIWREAGCAAEGAPYVLRGLLFRLGSTILPSYLVGSESVPFRSQSPQKPALAKAFLDEEHCLGARGLTEAEKAKLREIRDRSPPPATKQ